MQTSVRMAVLTWFVLLGLVATASTRNKVKQSYKWTEDGLLTLTRGVLKQAKQDFPALVVYVYGDWCLSAQGSVSKFIDLAHQHQVIDTKLVFGLLEVKDQRGLSKLSVKEVPAILAYSKESPHLITWSDNPDFDAIAHRLEMIYEELFIQVFESWTSLATFQATSSIVLFHGAKTKTSGQQTPIYWDFYKTAENHFSHHVNFGFLQPSSESQSQGLSKDSIYFCRRGDTRCIPYSRAETNVFELYDWVNSLTDEIIMDIDEQGHEKVIFIRDHQNLLPSDKIALENFEAASEQLSSSHLSAVCYLSKPKCADLWRHLETSLKDHDLPAVRKIVPILDSHGYFAATSWKHGVLTKESILKYVSDSDKGLLHFEATSESSTTGFHLESLEASYEGQPLTLHGTNLRTVLKDRKHRDLVLLLWQDDCASSQKYLELLGRLAKYLSSKSGAFMFATYNLSKNSHTGLKPTTVPALRLYKLHYGVHFDQLDPSTGADFNQMLNFVLDYSS